MDLAQAVAKIKEALAEIEGYNPKMHDKTVEQSYQDPVDQGNSDGDKKKMFAAKMRKMME